MRNVVPAYNRLSDLMQNPRQSADEVSSLIEDMASMNSRFTGTGTGIEMADGLIDAVQSEALLNRMHGDELRGIPSGWRELDRVLNGYGPEDLIVWVGRPGRGKSWFLLKQAHAAWVAGYKPLYVSMEMGGVQNMRRILGIHTGVNPTLIKKGQIGTQAWRSFTQKAEELKSLRPFHMVTANFSRTVDQIANFVEQYTPDIVFIDAGYLLSPKKKRYGSSGRRETISDVIEEIKELANNSHIPFVITVQFNRNAEQRRRGANTRRREGEAQAEVDPISHLSLAEIGETDVIGQAASHVLGIEYPPFPLPKNAYRVFGFLKGREGESGWWATTYMERQNSPVEIEIIGRDHPAYQQIIAGTRRQGNPRRMSGQERTSMMNIQD
jgi:replicative DNA helicase